MVKKWKGKDWFNILLPDEFGSDVITQTPTTDPKTLMGRNLEIGVHEITGDPKKMHMKLRLLLQDVEGRSIKSTFNGFECSRDHLLRMVRKRNKKVESIFKAESKDGWLLRITALSILNGSTNATVMKRTRTFMEKNVQEALKGSTANEFIRKVISSEMQLRIKKAGSKIYPIRFCEIAKVKVMRSPAREMVKAEIEKAAEEKKPKHHTGEKEGAPEKAEKKKKTEKPKKAKADSEEE